jgi:tRNA pseudouridine13 synthase
MANRCNPRSYLTENLPGIGGTIRERKEDFFVEEVPLYKPGGTGTHLYLLIEKSGMSTFEAIWKLASALKRKPADFGSAGLKDSEAVTRQYLSIEHVSPDAVQSLDLEGIRILEAVHHTNKLKMGHLRGNRFRILIRKPQADAAQKTAAVLEVLNARGIPNYYGPQRFGLFANTHLLGEAMFRRDWKRFLDILIATPRSQENPEYDEVIRFYEEEDYESALAKVGRSYKYERKALSALARKPDRPDRAVASIDKRMLQFYLSAFQSGLFNQYLEARLPRFDVLEQGDIACIHRNGACFLVEDPEREMERVESFEISPSGPLFGAKMLQAQGDPGRWERELLDEAGFKLEELKGLFGIRLRGARRPLRIPLDAVEVRERGEDLELAFFLPHGSYATVLLREVMKIDEILTST